MKIKKYRIVIICSAKEEFVVQTFQNEFFKYFNNYLLENKFPFQTNQPIPSLFSYSDEKVKLTFDTRNCIVDSTDLEHAKKRACDFVKVVENSQMFDIFYCGISAKCELGKFTNEIQEEFKILKKYKDLDNFNFKFCSIDENAYYNNVTLHTTNIVTSDVDLSVLNRKPSVIHFDGKNVFCSVDINDKFSFLTNPNHKCTSDSINKLSCYFDDFIKNKLVEKIKKL